MRIKPGQLIFFLILLVVVIVFVLVEFGVFNSNAPPTPQ
jgi:hypothetical protein